MSDSHRRRALIQGLESLHAAGVRQLPRVAAPEPVTQPEPPVGPAEPAGPQQSPIAQTEVPPAAAPHTAGEESADRATSVVSAAPDLTVLQQEVAGCTACEELARSRTQTVFGVGDPNAQLCFLGEAPGADEDRQGEPFVGRAGQLLTKIIEACHMRREDVYILNVLKCRPPGNRNPSPAETANCSRFLNRQLDLINPQFICCLGAVAAQNLLQTQTPIGRLRGSVHKHRGIQVVCTYHPAYLLRNPSAKRDTWEDMKRLMGLMGVEI